MGTFHLYEKLLEMPPDELEEVLEKQKRKIDSFPHYVPESLMEKIDEIKLLVRQNKEKAIEDLVQFREEMNSHFGEAIGLDVAAKRIEKQNKERKYQENFRWWNPKSWFRK